MSEIIIDQTDLNITVTPNTYSLNVFTGGYACAQGNTTEFQFNNGGVLGGANGLTYNSGSQTTTSANLTVTNNTDLGAIGNITITGGNAGDVLTTDGSGGLSFSEIANANFAAFAGNIIEAAQPNITSVGNLTNLDVTGNVAASYFIGNGSQLTGLAEGDEISNGSSNVRVLSANGAVAIGVNGNANILVANATGITVTRANLGNIANLNITGGNNGFVLQTDGTGNLTWTQMTGNAGNGTVGGSNTQIQYNDGGAFGGSAGFTFNKASNLLSIPGTLSAVGNISGNYILGDGGLLSNVAGGSFLANGNSNITIAANSNVTISAIGNANIVTVTGTGVNVAGTLNTGTGIITGNGSGLSALAGGNVTGQVGNALVAGTVYTAAQPNITSVGTLTSLGVNGTVTAVAFTANTGVFTGNGSGLSALAGANVTGQVANALVAGTVYTAAQPNITSVGNLTSLTVIGTSTIQQALEKITSNNTGSTGTVNFDVLDQAVLLKTANATANFSLNIRGNSTTTLNSIMSNNQSLTIAFINTNGATPYYATSFAIDGTTANVLFSPGSAGFVGTASGKDIYTYNIIKTAANTYTVFSTIIGFE